MISTEQNRFRLREILQVPRGRAGGGGHSFRPLKQGASSAAAGAAVEGRRWQAVGAWTVRCLKMDKVCLFVVGIRGAGSQSGTGSGEVRVRVRVHLHWLVFSCYFFWLIFGCWYF